MSKDRRGRWTRRILRSGKPVALIVQQPAEIQVVGRKKLALNISKIKANRRGCRWSNLLWMSTEVRPKRSTDIFSTHLVSAQNGTKATRPALSYQTAIYTSLRRLIDDMKLPIFLRRRSWLCFGSNDDLLVDRGQNEAVLLRTTESTPDLRIATSTLPTPSPLNPRNRESNGTQEILSLKITAKRV